MLIRWKKGSLKHLAEPVLERCLYNKLTIDTSIEIVYKDTYIVYSTVRKNPVPHLKL